ncbi:MAG TPA: FGGY family carbohydrate kinase [Planctomycetota bacterium]|nr:FGGY family carbohydrate kinase [Planctomycetota bacterium]
MTDLLVGIDIGTTHLKAGVFRANGEPCAVAERECAPDYLPGGRITVDPQKWWDGFADAVHECLANADRSRIRAIGICSQAQTFLRLDRDGRPVSPAVSWLDNTGDSGGIAGEVPLHDYYAHTGLPVPIPVLASAKLRTLATDAWADTCSLVFADGFLMQRLTGRCGVSRNIASMSGLYSMCEHGWWAPALQAARVSRRVLPELLDFGQAIGTVRPEIADALGIPPVPVVAGGNDQTTAALGAGLTNPGAATLGMGTAFVLCQVIDSGTPAASAFPFRGPYPGGLHWHLVLSNTAGAAMDWARKTLGGECAWDEFFAQALHVAPGAADATFDPDPNDGTCTIRAGLGSSREGLLRAVLDGTACTVHRLLDELDVPGAVRATGGGSRNDGWIQMLVDATGREFERCNQPHAGLWGAALMAGFGVGIFDDLLAAAEAARRGGRIFRPRPELRATYDRVYANYRALRAAELSR